MASRYSPSPAPFRNIVWVIICYCKTLCANGFLSADEQVLDSGRLKEYDEPYVLLQNEESLFYKMVQQLGKAEAAALIKTAQQVSGLRGAVITAPLSPSRLAIWHEGCSNEHPVPFPIISLRRRRFMTGS